MRVATRVAAGSGLLLALLGGVLVYQVVQLGRLADLSRELATVTFRAATVSLDLAESVDQLDEYTRKLFVTRDPDYAARVVEARDAAAARLRELTRLDLSPGEEEAVRVLRGLWHRFPFVTADAAAMVRAANARDRDATLAAAVGALAALRPGVQAALGASREAIGAQVAASAAAGDAAKRVSLVVMVLALLLSALTVTLIVRSISVPLGQLTRGTRAVAGGRFTTQLAVRGRDELSRVAEDFNSMVRRLGELDRLKRDFLSHVSHELKTPLVAMQETTQLLLDEAPGPLAPPQRRMLELDLRAARRLSRMIANLLDLSRLEAGEMPYEMRGWPLGELVEGAVSELQVLAGERGVTVEAEVADADAPVVCDRDRITQVVQNLLDNAIKFSGGGGVVRVTAGVAAPPRLPGRAPANAAGRWLRIAVQDRGPGLTEAEKAMVFDRFRQLPGGKRAGAGVGLGLAISREIVAAHGGEIWVEDNRGGGSVFVVALPAGAAGGRASGDGSREEP